MKLLPNTIFKSAGFTLVELLVVIGVLGILAAGLLATVDPLEQFRKAQDVNTRSTALELNNALIRYYANHNDYPWGDNGDVSVGGCKALFAATATTGAIANAAEFLPCLQVLQTEGELKSTFEQQTTIVSQLHVIDIGVGDEAKLATVCFNPQSKSVNLDINTMYDVTGAADAINCGTQALKVDGICYYCTR